MNARKGELTGVGIDRGWPFQIALEGALCTGQQSAVQDEFCKCTCGVVAQQPGTPAYCTELDVAELTIALQAADQSRAADLREKLIKQFSETGKMPSHEEVIALNRAVTA